MTVPAPLPPDARREILERLERLEIRVAARMGPLRAVENVLSPPPSTDRTDAAVRLGRLEAVVGSQERPR